MVLDDSATVRVILRQVLSEAGLEVELYASGEELLRHARLDRPGCLILDVAMPHMCGLEVQAQLKKRGINVPIIFLTGTSDISIAVAAMRAGAIDFIEKPFDNADLLARVRHAIDRRYEGRSEDMQRYEDMERYEALRKVACLTQREIGVLELVVSGQTSNEIAHTLGASHRTIEKHRLHIMEKMATPTLADLVHMRLLIRDEALHR